MALAVSPMLWARHQPDRFDIYGAGLVLMQLAIPEIRSEVSLKSFGVALKRAGYDLEAWRTQSRLARGKIEVLDADDGAGWKLAAAMLRKRVLEVEPAPFSR